jgi:hypothetical protein
MKRDELVTVGDLERFREDLLVAIRNLLRQPHSTDPKRWIKSSEIKKVCGLSISAGKLHTMRNNGTLPFTRIGGNIYYEYSDIMQMMRDHKSNMDENAENTSKGER